MSFSNLETILSGVGNFINDPLMPWNEKQDPEWLKSLSGDSPLLKRSEYEFISQVRSSITEEVKSRPNVLSNQHLAKKLSVMRDNFEQVVTYLRNNSGKKNYFLQNYPSWRNCREKSTLQLINIAKAVNKNSKESASTRGAGSTVSLVGGLICLVPGLGVLRLAGGVLMGLGSLAALGASLAEFETLHQKIQEAEKIMLQDREYSERLWSWMRDSSHLQEAYNTVTSVDVNLKNIATDLHDCFQKKSTLEAKSIPVKTIIAKVAKLQFSQWMAEDVIEVIVILLATFMLHDRYRPLFDTAFETYECERILSRANDVAATAVKITSLVKAGRSKINPFQKYRLGIGIALDVISIVNAAKDFEETSKEAAAIAEAAEKLQEEADIFKNLYDAVKCA